MGIFEGISKIDNDWTLPPWAKDKILAAVKRDEQDTADFIKLIENAVRSALSITERQENLSRAKLKAKLNRAANAANELVSALEDIPMAGTRYFQGSYSDTIQKAKALHTTVTNAVEKAKPYLSGRGADPNYVPFILAGKIAYALQTIGIKPTVSRPKGNQKGEIKSSPYWQIAEVCFKLAGLPNKDLRNHLREGLEVEHIDPEKIGG